jgi:hypothetical protein
MHIPLSRCLSAAGVCFLGILSRQGLPPLSRSAYRTATCGADPDGVSMFRTRETRLGLGALCTPGTVVPAARPRMNPMTTAFQRPVPVTPVPHPSRDAFLTRHQHGFTDVHPPSLPLACNPRTVRASLGFTLSFTPG